MPLTMEPGGGLRLSLPAGAATAAKQPAIGTAGMPSGDLLTVQGANGMTPISAGGITSRSSVEFTRPADTTAYAANDAVSNSTSAPTVLTFPNVARISGGTGVILSGRLTANSATTTNASFRLWIFNESVTATNDNAAYPLLYANAAKRVGYIDFVLSTEGSGSDCAVGTATGVNLDYACVGSRDLYGLLVAKAAYGPNSGQKFTVELGVVND